MRKRLLSLILGITLTSTLSFAWGPEGHQTIATVGGDVASIGSFWRTNKDTLTQLSTVPDRTWKAPSTKPREAGQHWFQIDPYLDTTAHPEEILNFPKTYSAAVAKYSASTVDTNGTAVWRTIQFYKLAIAAAKANDLTSVAKYAGILCHYVGDLSQPLHTTDNYDGQKTGNKGVHAWFETAVLKADSNLASDVEERTRLLVKDPQFLAEFKGDLADILLHESLRSFRAIEKILQIDTQYGRAGKGRDLLLDIAIDRLADGAATYALILDRISMESGATLPNTQVQVADPASIKPALL